MPLPPIPEDEIKLARAASSLVLGDSPVPEGEGFYELLARCFVLRTKRMDLLRNQINAEAQSSHTPHEKAYASFMSKVCPACGEDKRAGKDFFGIECWRLLTKAKLHGFLWQGWKEGRHVSEYLRALAFLREQGRKVAEAL